VSRLYYILVLEIYRKFYTSSGTSIFDIFGRPIDYFRKT